MYQSKQTLCFPFNLGCILSNEADTEAVLCISRFTDQRMNIALDVDFIPVSE